MLLKDLVTYTYPTFTIDRFTVGELATNCYIVTCQKTQECIIIDPGDEGGFISEHILRERSTPQAILLTHGHFDHVLGCLELKSNFNIPIFLHPADTFLLERAQQSAVHWLKHPVDPVPPADQNFSEGHLIPCGQLQLTVLSTPGHTPGSVSFVLDQCLFSGDTLFLDSVGSTDHSYSNKRELKKSLQRLHSLRTVTELFAGHGEVGKKP